jgi:hypothetical protein
MWDQTKPVRLALIAAFLTAALVPGAWAADMIDGLAPISPQPQAGQLQPGLAVTYYFHIFNHVNEVIEFAKSNPGQKGAPILALDYKVGSGPILTSGRTNGIGAAISGLIRFPATGLYRMVVQSNDGVRITIDSQIVLSDPDVHADRFSKIIPVRIDTPGWYPISVDYFERRNTATLRLYWLPPMTRGGLRYVPADNLAHLPD